VYIILETNTILVDHASTSFYPHTSFGHIQSSPDSTPELTDNSSVSTGSSVTTSALDNIRNPRSAFSDFSSSSNSSSGSTSASGSSSGSGSGSGSGSNSASKGSLSSSGKLPLIREDGTNDLLSLIKSTSLVDSPSSNFPEGTTENNTPLPNSYSDSYMRDKKD
jgi:hypothetical protein